MANDESNAILEQNDHTTIAANIVAGTITITTDFEHHAGQPEAAIAEALWLLRDGRVRDRRPGKTTAALMAAASIIERALATDISR